MSMRLGWLEGIHLPGQMPEIPQQGLLNPTHLSNLGLADQMPSQHLDKCIQPSDSYTVRLTH